MVRRRVLNLSHSHHTAPIPAAVLIDRFLFSSAVFGAARETGEVPDDAADEVRALFENVEELLANANASADDVARVDVLLRNDEYREIINEEWLRLFPDPDDRPARHITLVPNLPARAQVQFIAVLPEHLIAELSEQRVDPLHEQRIDDLGNPA